VRITSGTNLVMSNGVLASFFDEIVVLDDFFYATPTAAPGRVPDSGSVVVLLGGALLALAALKRRIVA